MYEEGVIPELPWANQRFLHFLTNLAICSHEHEEQKRVGSAIRVTHLAGSPFFDGRVNFSPYKHFGVSSVNWIKGRQSEHAQALLSALGFKLLGRAKRSTFLAKVDSAGRVTLFPGRDNFARYKRVLEKFGLLSSVVVLRKLNKQRGY